MRSKVYVQFPKAGLGNKLLTWSRGYVFAQLNGLEMHTSSWFSFFVGAWLRRENKKRLYIGYFKERDFFSRVRFFGYRLFMKKSAEPPIEKLEKMPRTTLFIFNKTYRDYDFFKEIRPYRQIVKDGLLRMLSPSVRLAYNAAHKPAIGIHVRRGDFKIANPITPVEFFVEAITDIRRQAGSSLPVTIFTDADKHELEEISAMPNVAFAPPQADIIDILLLSDSRYLLTSVSSTFSYWAAFLSSGVVIKPPKEWHVPFRSADDPLFHKETIWDGSFHIEN